MSQLAEVQLAEELQQPYYNVLDHGAIGDGIADDTAVLNAAFESGLPVLLPKPLNAYKVTSTLKLKHSPIIMSLGAVIRAHPGSYESIFEFGVNPTGNPPSTEPKNTGYRVLLDLKECVKPRIMGRLTLSVSDKDDFTDLVAIASSRLGEKTLPDENGNTKELGGFNGQFDQIHVYGCKIGLYAQPAFKPVAGPFTGTVIQHFETSEVDEDINFNGSQDDFIIVIHRCRGLINLNSSGIQIQSLYLFGSKLDKNGILIGTDGYLYCEHAFIEGKFKYPIFINGDGGKFKTPDLNISKRITSTNKTIIFTSRQRAEIDISLHPVARQGVHDPNAPLDPTDPVPKGWLSLVELTINTVTDTRLVSIGMGFQHERVVPVTLGASSQTYPTFDRILIHNPTGLLLGSVESNKVIHYLTSKKRGNYIEYIPDNSLPYTEAKHYTFDSGSLTPAINSTYTFTLPKSGVYLLNAQCYGQHSDPNHAITQNFLITFIKGSINVLMDSEPIGKQLKNGNAQSIAVSPPTNTGQVSITFTQLNTTASKIIANVILFSSL